MIHKRLKILFIALFLAQSMAYVFCVPLSSYGKTQYAAPTKTSFWKNKGKLIRGVFALLVGSALTYSFFFKKTGKKDQSKHDEIPQKEVWPSDDILYPESTSAPTSVTITDEYNNKTKLNRYFLSFSPVLETHYGGTYGDQSILSEYDAHRIEAALHLVGISAKIIEMYPNDSEAHLERLAIILMNEGVVDPRLKNIQDCITEKFDEFIQVFNVYEMTSAELADQQQAHLFILAHCFSQDLSDSSKLEYVRLDGQSEKGYDYLHAFKRHLLPRALTIMAQSRNNDNPELFEQAQELKTLLIKQGIASSYSIEAHELARIAGEIVTNNPDNFEDKLEEFAQRLMGNEVDDQEILNIQQCVKENLLTLVKIIHDHQIESADFFRGDAGVRKLLCNSGAQGKDLKEQAHLHVLAYIYFHSNELNIIKDDLKVEQKPSTRENDPFYDFKSHILLQAAKSMAISHNKNDHILFKKSFSTINFFLLQCFQDPKQAGNFYRWYSQIFNPGGY